MEYSDSGNIRRVLVNHCEALNEDGDVLISWPSYVKAEGYIITRCYDDGRQEEIQVTGALNTKFIDKTSGHIKYSVEAYKHYVKDTDLEHLSLLGSIEQAKLRGNGNTLISDYILSHYDELMLFVKKLPHIDTDSVSMLLDDVWESWKHKEQSGEGYSPDRLSKGGNCLTVKQVVENSLKSYAKNSLYTKKYNNKDKNNGVEVELHSVSMLEEREEGSENNFITAQASLKTVKGTESPLEDMVAICTLKEDLSYVLTATKDFKVSARNILDNYSYLIQMLSDDSEKNISPGEEVIKNMNKTLFSEYKSSMELVDMFDRIFVFMHRDMELFHQIYNELIS
jgi:hypothetical protein